jgi:NTE family protein
MQDVVLNGKQNSRVGEQANDKEGIMDSSGKRRKIAVACQGGGSHTAFTAGVLRRLLAREQGEYEFVAFSGTSGGAICALLTWYGLLTGGRDEAAKLLETFWTRDNSANTVPERFLNDWIVNSTRWQQETGFLVEQSPNVFSDLTQDELGRSIERNVKFDRIDGDLVRPESPKLFVGAVEVITGGLKVFRSHKREETNLGEPRFVFEDNPNDGITLDAVLASSAIPPLFRAVRIGRGVYWDGLFAQNPPVRDLPDAEPDEIWIIQINPSRLVPEADEPRPGDEPTKIANILDRRNELAGNLSLEQELRYIRKINELVRERRINDLLDENPPSGNKREYRYVEVRKPIENRRPLDYATKLDRSSSFIQEMMTYGEEQADEFLDELSRTV